MLKYNASWITSLNNTVQILLKSDENQEIYVGFIFPCFLIMEAAILDIY